MEQLLLRRVQALQLQPRGIVLRPLPGLVRLAPGLQRLAEQRPVLPDEGAHPRLVGVNPLSAANQEALWKQEEVVVGQLQNRADQQKHRSQARKLGAPPGIPRAGAAGGCRPSWVPTHPPFVVSTRACPASPRHWPCHATLAPPRHRLHVCLGETASSLLRRRQSAATKRRVENRRWPPNLPPQRHFWPLCPCIAVAKQPVGGLSAPGWKSRLR
jgi:hypothetical protein